MVCNPLMPLTCAAPLISSGADAATDAAADAAVSAAGNAFAETMRDGATWVIKTTVAWWIQVPAVDLEHSPARAIRGYVLWLALVIAVGGVIWQGVMTAVSRRPEPILAVGRGLFVLALWAAIGLAGPATALRAGDAFSDWVLDQAAGGQAADRLITTFGLKPITSPGAVIVIALVMMLLGLVQALLMVFREASIIVLGGVIVLAAAGSITGATRPWLPRVLGWLLALICYKPAAALVYASAIGMVGESADARSFLIGIAMMLLSIIALPTLMKLFTWTSGSVGGGGGGLAALAGATGAALHAGAAATYQQSRTAQNHADTLRSDLDHRPGSGPGGSPSPSPGPTCSPSPPPQTPAPSGPPTGGAGHPSPGPAPSGGGPGPTPTGGSPGPAPTGGMAPTLAAAPSPWIIAAAALTEAARNARDAAQSAADPDSPKDQP